MSSRRCIRRLALGVALAAAALQTSCLSLPREGEPVWVDVRAGDFWSGEGKLLEVSGDGSRCRVSLRARSGFVESRWVLCKHVHPRRL